jgi:SAM-dependent methyltransferase
VATGLAQGSRRRLHDGGGAGNRPGRSDSATIGAVDGYGPSTYGDAFADVYDEWYEGSPAAGDTRTAVSTIADLAGDGAVLELGVGSGRLAVPLAARGVPTWGIDASAAMLDRLRGRAGGEAVHAALGDMAEPAAVLGEEAPAFAVVVAAFNTFFLLAAAEAQRRCLEASAALLADDGVVVVECFVPADPPAAAEHVLEPRRIALDHVVLTISDHRPTEQIVIGQHVELRESGIRLRPWMLRYLTPAQLDELADGAGLRLRARWAGWDRAPFDDGSAVHVSVYRRR